MTKEEQEKRDLNQLKVEICDEICTKIMAEEGFQVGEHTISISPNMRVRWGLCYVFMDEEGKRSKPSRIRISKDLLDDDADESFLLGVVGHELIHACTDGNYLEHDERFLKRADTLYKRGIYANLSFSQDELYEDDIALIPCECGMKTAICKGEKLNHTCCCGRKIKYDGERAFDEEGNELTVLDYEKSYLCPI